ncbi:MAG: efflux RND transporter periplasmic adaptor subunit [Polyangia bacterium]
MLQLDEELIADLSSLKLREKEPAGAPRTAGPPRMRWRLGGAALIVTVAALGVYVYRGLHQPVLQRVEVATISGPADSQAPVLSATGYVVPRAVVKLASPVSGVVKEVLPGVLAGSPVAAGARLVLLDDRGPRRAVSVGQARISVAQARAAAARAALREAQAQAERARSLAGTASGPLATAQDLELRSQVLAAALKAAEGELTSLVLEQAGHEQALGQAQVLAPVAGILLTPLPQVGEFLQAGAPLLELADTSELFIEADVAEQHLRLIELKMPCEATLDALPGWRYRGEVASLSPRVNRAKGTLAMRVRLLPGPPQSEGAQESAVTTLVLRIDMAARIAVLPRPGQAPSRPHLPERALRPQGSGQVVFVLSREGTRVTVRSAPVRVGAGLPGEPAERELLEGPPVGTEIVAEPAADLADGQEVRVRAPS